jgi:hypothetical protein
MVQRLSLAAALMLLATPCRSSAIEIVEGNEKPIEELTCENSNQNASFESQEEDNANEDDTNTCSLYMARSSIPNAGLGIYTGVDVPEGESISDLEDLFIPIADKYKTIPYRGQQRFLSWLGYVWPTEIDAFYPSYHDGSFPYLHRHFYLTPEGLNGADDGLFFYADGDQQEVPINALAPGMASLLNSHGDLVNVHLDVDSLTNDFDENEEGDEDSSNNNSCSNSYEGAHYSPHYGVSFVADDDIAAGSELFIYYGDEWHSRYENKLQLGVAAYDTFEQYTENHVNDLVFPTEQDKRDQLMAMNEREAVKKERLEQVERQRRSDVEAVLATQLKPTRVKTEMPLRQTEYQASQTTMVPTDRKLSEPTSDKNEDEEVQLDTVKDLEWLQTHGSCVDRLTVGPSTIPDAGRGAFASRFLAQGITIAPAPLLALKREDLIMYAANEEPNQKIRNTLDFSNIVGTELLMNYCYGHADSELLLVPYAPAVNFINHAPSSDQVNAIIRWPEAATAQRLLQRTPTEWLSQHPLDVMDQSGQLMMEFVATRDIAPGDEILIDYGSAWQAAWDQYSSVEKTTSKETSPPPPPPFRHEIAVPEGFFPDNWLHQSLQYELTPIEHLSPGEIVPLTWKHNGQHIAKSAYVVGLPQNLTSHMLDFCDRRGITSTYQQLLAESILDSNEWYVFEAAQHTTNDKMEEWFAIRYKSVAWDFNMHYIAAWNEVARQSVFSTLGMAGYDAVLQGVGSFFGLDYLHCFHSSFMGVSEADHSFMHADVYATGEVGYNIIFPIVTVDGSKPELDLQSDNADIVVSVKYQHDRAFVMSDWGYHKTSAVAYDQRSQMRMVMGMYCAQIDATNAKSMKYIYNWDDPAPFMDQFDTFPLPEIHWDKQGQHHL